MNAITCKFFAEGHHLHSSTKSLYVSRQTAESVTVSVLTGPAGLTAQDVLADITADHLRVVIQWPGGRAETVVDKPLHDLLCCW